MIVFPPRTINYKLTVMNHVFNIVIREWGLASDNPDDQKETDDFRTKKS